MSNEGKNWLDEVVRSVENLDTPAPEGAWEAVSSAIARKKRSGRRLAVIVASALAAAAAVTSVVFLPWGETQDKGGMVNPYADDFAENVSIDSLEPEVVADEPEMKDVPPLRTAYYALPADGAADAPAVKPSVSDPGKTDEDTPVRIEEIADDSKGEPSDVQRQNDAVAFERRMAELLDDEKPARPRGLGRFSVGGNVDMSLSGPGTVEIWDPGIISATRVMNTGFYGLSLVRKTQGGTKESAFRYRHLQPISIKLAYSLPIYGGLFAETGLTYTILRSNVLSHNPGKEVVGQQTLQFLGIPLNLGFTVYETGRSSFYLLAGGEVQECISARMQQNTIKIDPVFWSADAAAGYLFRLTRGLGLFLEAGGTYHFRNDAFQYTIYDNNPLQFSLQAGLRIK